MEKVDSRRYATASQVRGSSRHSYIEGSTARKLSAVETPVRRDDRSRKPRPVLVPGTGQGWVEEQQLGFGAVLVVSVCALLALFICAGYLQLQAQNTRSLKQIAALEAQLTELRTENDDQYNRLMSSVNLNEIREVAMQELGMVYANADQIILYDSQTNDYVRQYKEVPQEVGTGLSGIFGSK